MLYKLLAGEAPVSAEVRTRWLRGVVAVLVAALVATLSACSSAPDRPTAEHDLSPAPSSTQASDPLRLQVVFTAMQMVGIPYRWGGATPEGFDCSGLVQYTYAHAGLKLPRTAAEQLAAARPISLDQAVPGDLLFFQDGGRTSHVAIYLGGGRFIHAPRSGQQVSLDSFGNDYWRARFRRAGSFIPMS